MPITAAESGSTAAIGPMPKSFQPGRSPGAEPGGFEALLETGDSAGSARASASTQTSPNRQRDYDRPQPADGGASSDRTAKRTEGPTAEKTPAPQAGSDFEPQEIAAPTSEAVLQNGDEPPGAKTGPLETVPATQAEAGREPQDAGTSDATESAAASPALPPVIAAVELPSPPVPVPPAPVATLSTNEASASEALTLLESASAGPVETIAALDSGSAELGTERAAPAPPQPEILPKKPVADLAAEPRSLATPTSRQTIAPERASPAAPVNEDAPKQSAALPPAQKLDAPTQAAQPEATREQSTIEPPRASLPPQDRPPIVIPANDVSGAWPASPQHAGLHNPALDIAGARLTPLAPVITNPSMPVPLAGIAVEIAARALTDGNRFEIRLDPPELGRIDVRLDVDRAGHVTSRLVVERAETLDLLRREASNIERALEQAGLKTSDNTLQFSLRDQSAGADRNSRQPLPNATRLLLPDDSGTVEATGGYGRPIGRGGLDIRV